MWTTPIAPEKNTGELVRGEMLALEVRGRIGFPNGYGNTQFGYNRIGDQNPLAGVYQRRHAKKVDSRFPRFDHKEPKYVVQLIPYPTNPQTALQQAQRAKMALAVYLWKSLTPEEKQTYNEAAKKRNKRGYDLFKTLNMEAQQSGFGFAVLGTAKYGEVATARVLQPR